TNSVHTVVFDEGETYASFHLQIIDDTIVEGPETVNLALVNPTGGATIGEQPQATLTIISDDSVISFLTSTYSVSENVLSGSAVISVVRTGATNTSVSVDYRTEYETNAVITIVRTNGSSGVINVHYATLNGSAQAGLDYTAVSGDISFADGETAKTFNVPITPDYILEPDETVILLLSLPLKGSG